MSSTTFILTTLVICAALLTVSFISIEYAKSLNTQSYPQDTQVSVIDYGNGVLWFNTNIQKNFGNELSNYVYKYPNLKVSSVSSNDYWGGYWVVVENKSVGC